MLGKKPFTLLILLFLLEPSYSSLNDKLDINYTQLLEERKVGLKDFVDGAEFLASSVFNETSEFGQKYPQTRKFVNALVQYGTTATTPADLVYLGTAVYLGAVVVSSYRHLVDSRELLAQVESIDHKLNVSEKQINIVLQTIEMMIKGSTEGQKEVCDQKLDVMRMLKEGRDAIHEILNIVKRIKNQAIEGEEQSEVLKIGTVVVAFVGGAIAAPRVAPSFLGVSVVVVLSCAAATLGYFRFSKSKQTYQTSIQLLGRSEDRERAAEIALAVFEKKIESGCMFGFTERSQNS